MLMFMPSTRSAASPAAPTSRAEEVALDLRTHIVNGGMTPGERLAEVALAERYDVSRNTLREAFRLLSQEGLLTLVPNRGASVAVPTVSSIIDLYRVRRFIEVQALRAAFPKHPAIRRMRDAVAAARAARMTGDWNGVGTANIAFHAAVVELTDSPRLGRVYEQIAAELRLAFGLVDDPEYLHTPFLEMNAEIVAKAETGDTEAAANALDAYLVQAERLLLAAYERR